MKAVDGSTWVHAELYRLDLERADKYALQVKLTGEILKLDKQRAELKAQLKSWRRR